MSHSGLAARLSTRLALPLTASLLLFTGCGIGTPAIPSPVAIPALRGHVMGGQQPLAGTTIRLYAIGSAGNGTAALDILGTGTNGPATSVSSGPDGSFSISGDYTCPALAPSTPVYLTATGGNPGLNPSVDNAAIALVAALGPCNTLFANAATTYITINEATTAAAAWALSPFATSLTAIGASSTNLTGITNAMLTANLLADPTSGLSPGSATPVGALIESAKLYSLADILASCVNSTGLTTACSGLFTDVTPTGGTRPTDTFAAALSVVQNPGNNVANIFNNHIGATPPFTALSAPPNDWTMSISYSEYSGPLSGSSISAMDASGNFWGLGNGATSQNLVSFDRQFNPLLSVPICPYIDGSCYGTAPFYGSGFTIDSSGDIWLAQVFYTPPTGGDYTAETAEFSSSGVLLSPVGGTTAGGATDPTAIAADTNGLVWVANPYYSPNKTGGDVSVFSNANATVSPSTGYGSQTSFNPVNIALDSFHTAWITSSDSIFGNGPFPAITSIAAPSPLTPNDLPAITRYTIPNASSLAIAVDPDDNVWFTNGAGGAYSLTGNAPAFIYNQLGVINRLGTLVSSTLTGGGLTAGFAMATDPGNHLWIVNADPNTLIFTLSEFSTAASTLGLPLSPSTGLGPDANIVGSGGSGFGFIPGVFIDASGDLCIAGAFQNQGDDYDDSQSPVFTTFVGLATPTSTPLLGPPKAP